MKSPKDQKIIQIEVTNVCMHSCSNCTRFCGHHRKPFFLDFETFKKAVDSLQGYAGMIGLMGGEPTLHPNFEKFAEYLATKTDSEARSANGRFPIRDFAAYRSEYLSDVAHKRGLWTSLGNGYYKHFDIIQKIFEYQCINDHCNPGLHQALMITRKELGIPDEEWIRLRDNCWIQNLWSSSLGPKGAFFCEVAAALDMLFDGPGGWPIEPGWWKRKPEDFGDQLRWCELCSAALHVPRRKAHDEMDDVSPLLYAKLEAVKSPKIEKGGVRIFDTAAYDPKKYACRPTYEWYLPDEDSSKRISGTNRSLYPRRITAVIVSVGLGELLAESLKNSARHFDKVIVATLRDDRMTRDVAKDCGVLAIYPEPLGDATTKDAMLNEAFKALSPDDWVMVLDADCRLAEDAGERLRDWILNPGCLYEFGRSLSMVGVNEFAGTSGALAAVILPDKSGEYRSSRNLFLLFNAKAMALRGKGSAFWPTATDRAVRSEELFRNQWPADQRIDLLSFLAGPTPMDTRRRTGEVTARHVVSVWQILTHCGLRIALFGAGQHTRWLLALLRKSALNLPTAIFEDNPFSPTLDGIQVLRPVDADPETFDAVVVSSDQTRTLTALSNRCRQLWGESKPAIHLYRGFIDGPFVKVTTTGTPIPPR